MITVSGIDQGSNVPSRWQATAVRMLSICWECPRLHMPARECFLHAFDWLCLPQNAPLMQRRPSWPFHLDMKRRHDWVCNCKIVLHAALQFSETAPPFWLPPGITCRYLVNAGRGHPGQLIIHFQHFPLNLTVYVVRLSNLVKLACLL